MRKIKWENVIKLNVFIVSMVMILHDMFMIIFRGYSWTWYGFITFILFTTVASMIYEDFEEQIKSTNSITDQSFRKGASK